MAAYSYGENEFTTPAKFIALAASLVLCWIIFKVKMKECEQTVSRTAALLQPLHRAATAAETRQRVVKAATLVVEKTLAEYKSLITMLHQIPETDFDREDFPPLRQELEEESIKSQVQMVKDCLTAASNELLKTFPQVESTEIRQEKVLSSLYEQEQLVTSISEEILAALDSRKRRVKGYYADRDLNVLDSSFGGNSRNNHDWQSKAVL